MRNKLYRNINTSFGKIKNYIDQDNIYIALPFELLCVIKLDNTVETHEPHMFYNGLVEI